MTDPTIIEQTISDELDSCYLCYNILEIWEHDICDKCVEQNGWEEVENNPKYSEEESY